MNLEGGRLRAIAKKSYGVIRELEKEDWVHLNMTKEKKKATSRTMDYHQDRQQGQHKW